MSQPCLVLELSSQELNLLFLGLTFLLQILQTAFSDTIGLIGRKVLLRQQFYATKNQLGQPKPLGRGFGTQNTEPGLSSLLLADSLQHKIAGASTSSEHSSKTKRTTLTLILALSPSSLASNSGSVRADTVVERKEIQNKTDQIILTD